MFDDAGGMAGMADDFDPSQLQDLDGKDPAQNPQNGMGGMGDGILDYGWKAPDPNEPMIFRDFKQQPTGPIDYGYQPPQAPHIFRPGMDAGTPPESKWKKWLPSGKQVQSMVGGAAKLIGAKDATAKAQGEAALRQLRQQQLQMNAQFKAQQKAIARQTGAKGDFVSRYGIFVVLGILVIGGVVYMTAKRR